MICVSNGAKRYLSLISYLREGTSLSLAYCLIKAEFAILHQLANTASKILRGTVFSSSSKLCRCPIFVKTKLLNYTPTIIFKQWYHMARSCYPATSMVLSRKKNPRMSATIDNNEDERRPVVRQWLNTAELQGEPRYENRINKTTARSWQINSLTTKKQTTKFSSADFRKMLRPRYIILKI